MGLEVDDAGMLGLPRDAAEDNWPQFPLIPVKNYKRADKEDGGMPMCGIVLHPSIAPKSIAYFVAIINLFDLGKDVVGSLTAAKRVKYESFEEMVGDGWVVD
jgi:hypothetical protein